MRFALVVSGPAKDDLAKHYAWYETHGSEVVAELFLKAVQSSFTKLVALPSIGRERHFSEPELKDIRSFNLGRQFKRHIVFYRITVQGIRIERVLHGSQDLPNRLLSDDAETSE